MDFIKTTYQMREVKAFFVVALWITTQFGIAQSFIDEPFLQPISKKYAFQKGEAGNTSKLLIDRDDNVYVLTDQNFYVLLDGQLVENRMYRPLQGKVPLDVTIQDRKGILYYLYDDHYLSNAHAGKPYGSFPSGLYNHIAVNASGAVMLTGNKDFALMNSDHDHSGKIKHDILEVKAHGNDFYILTDEGISHYDTEKNDFDLLIAKKGITSWTITGDRIFAGESSGYSAFALNHGGILIPLKEAIPVAPPTSMAAHDDEIWMGSHHGMYKTKNHTDFRYFASKRWLSEDEVIDVAVDKKGNGYALTTSGVSKVHYEKMTLQQKADYFQEKVRKRHLRYGLIGEVRLQEPGNIKSMELVDTDNDGLWTSFYLGSEVFRYAATKDPEAKQNAMESFEAFERLLSLNPLDGFPSRTFEREGYKVADPNRWRDGVDEGWEWKGHTSSDEFVAYIWITGIMHQYLDLSPEEEARVIDFFDQIMSHILDNDYYFVDIDGKPTLWGRWNPEYLNHYPESVIDRKLGSLTITAGLHLAYELTGKEKYKESLDYLWNEHGYLDNIRIPMAHIQPTPDVFYEGMDMGEGGWNHSDDEMAFLTYWILYHFAPDEELKNIYADVIIDHFEIEKPERNSLWSLITFGTAGEIDLPSVKWHLQEFQMDMIRWTMKNSHRKDLNLLEPNFREQSTEQLLPPAERATMRYNGNPFKLDGGRGGTRELAGDEYLLPYWMGKYLNVIQSKK